MATRGVDSFFFVDFLQAQKAGLQHTLLPAMMNRIFFSQEHCFCWMTPKLMLSYPRPPSQGMVGNVHSCMGPPSSINNPSKARLKTIFILVIHSCYTLLRSCQDTTQGLLRYFNKNYYLSTCAHFISKFFI